MSLARQSALRPREGMVAPLEIKRFAARGALVVESVDAVENSVGGHGRVRVGPSFGTGDRQGYGTPVGWRDRFLGRGWQGHHGASPAGGRQPAMRGLRSNEPFLRGL